MPARHIIACASLVATTIFWGLWLLVSPDPFTDIAALVAGTGFVLTAAVAAAGILVEHSRLAYRIGWGLLGGLGVVAVMRPLDAFWFAGMLLAGISALTMVRPTLDGWIRSEPPAAPIPKAAIGVSLLLLTTPPVVAIASVGHQAEVLAWLALSSWLVLYWYVRRLPGAMAAVRLGLPILAVAGWWLPLPSRLLWMAAMTTASILAWRAATRLAVRPLIERGSTVLVPPELALDEIRQAIERNRRDR